MSGVLDRFKHLHAPKGVHGGGRFVKKDFVGDPITAKVKTRASATPKTPSSRVKGRVQAAVAKSQEKSATRARAPKTVLKVQRGSGGQGGIKDVTRNGVLIGHVAGRTNGFEAQTPDRKRLPGSPLYASASRAARALSEAHSEHEVGVTPYKGTTGAVTSKRMANFRDHINEACKREGVTLQSVENTRGVWQGGSEPSARVILTDGTDAVQRVADSIGGEYRQDGVVRFRRGEGDSYRFTSTGPEVTHEQLAKALDGTDIPGATLLPDGRVEIIDTNGDAMQKGHIEAVAKQLGIGWHYERGQAEYRASGAEYQKWFKGNPPGGQSDNLPADATRGRAGGRAVSADVRGTGKAGAQAKEVVAQGPIPEPQRAGETATSTPTPPPVPTADLPVSHEAVDAAFKSLVKGQEVTIAHQNLPALCDKLQASNQPINLENLHVTGMDHGNLFDTHATETPRTEMPQIPGDAETLALFKSFLKEHHIKVKEGQYRPSDLHATQNELDGSKSAGIYKGYDISRAGVLFVDRNGAVLDGHHRWAAGVFFEVGQPDYKVSICRIDADIHDLLPLAEEFDVQQGIKHQAFGGKD